MKEKNPLFTKACTLVAGLAAGLAGLYVFWMQPMVQRNDALEKAGQELVGLNILTQVMQAVTAAGPGKIDAVEFDAPGKLVFERETDGGLRMEQGWSFRLSKAGSPAQAEAAYREVEALCRGIEREYKWADVRFTKVTLDAGTRTVSMVWEWREEG